KLSVIIDRPLVTPKMLPGHAKQVGAWGQLRPESDGRTILVCHRSGRSLAQLGPLLEPAQQRLVGQAEFRRSPADAAVFAEEGFGNQFVLLLLNWGELPGGRRPSDGAWLARHRRWGLPAALEPRQVDAQKPSARLRSQQRTFEQVAQFADIPRKAVPAQCVHVFRFQSRPGSLVFLAESEQQCLGNAINIRQM